VTPPSLEDLAGWLRTELDEVEPLRRPGPAPVRRLALALEPADLPPTLEADALFLHRSRRIGDGWPGLGVLGVHDGFDEHLTTGPNRRLAARLGWADVQEVTHEGRRVGLIATAPQASWSELRAALHAELGGEDTSWLPPGPFSSRLALMNAMNPVLITLVAGLGARVYLTGQLRPSAVAAARDQRLGVVALGHRRTELWGLHQLARELRLVFPGLETTVFSGEAPPTSG